MSDHTESDSFKFAMANQFKSRAQNMFKPGTQMHAFYKSHDAVADQNEVMLELLYGTNPISDDELARLIQRNPAKYSRFSGYIGKRSK